MDRMILELCLCICAIFITGLVMAFCITAGVGLLKILAMMAGVDLEEEEDEDTQPETISHPLAN